MNFFQTRREFPVLGLALIFLLVLGAVFRLQDVTKTTIGHTEMYVPGIPLPAGISDPQPRFNVREILTGLLVDQEPNPPAYYVLMLGWTKLFGTDILALRLPSVLFGVASILLIFLIGALEHDRWVGILASGMLAFNGHQIIWSQIAKMYEMGCFLGLLSTFTLLSAAKSGRWQRLFLFLYIVSTFAGLATVVFFWFLFFAQMLWVLVSNLNRKSPASKLIHWQILVSILASPLLSLAIFQARRESYLATDTLPAVAQFLQFGFLFEPDPLALPPKSLPMIIGIGLLLLALFLLFFGLFAQRNSLRTVEEVHAGLPVVIPILAAILVSLFIFRFSRFTTGFDAERTKLVLASSALPLFFLVSDLFLRRYSFYLQRILLVLDERLPLDRIRRSLNSLLVVVPLGMLIAVSIRIPLVASRTVLLFTPYLLVVLSAGMVSLVHLRKQWLLLLPILGLAFGSSVIYYKDTVFEHPRDYKTLAEKWIPQIHDSDLIFFQRSWVTTPIFYYLNGARYHFVGTDFSEAVRQSPSARIWVLNFAGLPLTSEMESVLNGYENMAVVEALRIQAALYVKSNVALGSTSQNTTTQNSLLAAFTLSFSTYLGGLRDDTIRDITTDAQGNIYVTGGAASPNFPTTTGPAFNSTPCSTLGTAGQMDVFITKLSPAGQILWSRLLGGPCYDRAYALKVDPQGYVYVAGRAGTGYPTTSGTVQTTFGGQDPSAYSYGAYGAQDGFITKLSPDGTQIVWSTFFGSNDWSFIRDIDLDSSGNVYLVMAAVGRPNQHITPGAFQTHLAGGEDMVVAKISADGSRAIWATYLGGSGDDGGGPSIRVDSTGHAYVLGTTNSTNFPTTLGAFQRTFGGTLDFVVTQFTSDGSGLVFSTYLGGSGEESTETHEIALDPQGNAYITGYVNSTNFPTTLGAFQRTSGGGYDVAVAKLSKDGTKLLASTYLGGSGAEGSQGIVIDAQGNVNIFGVTNSTNLPLSVSPYQPSNAGGDDFFVAKFSPDLSQLLFSTNLGGSGADQGRAGWIDSNGNVIVAGMTQSDNWPVRNAVQAKRAGDWDGAVAKFSSSGSTQVGPNKIYLPVVIR